MVRRYQRLSRRRRPQSRRRYVVPVVLITFLLVAIIYGIWGKDGDKSEDPNETADNNKAAVNLSEVDEKEPTVEQKERVVIKLPQPEPEPLPPPVPDPTPETEPKKEVTKEIPKEIPKEEPKKAPPVVSPVPDVSPNPEATALIADATALLAEKPAKVIAARTKFSQAFRMPMSRQQRMFVKDQLSKLADKWLFSPTIYPDDTLCGSYKVKPGDLLSTIAKKYKVPWEILMKINNIRRPEALRAGETIKVIYGPFHARVDRSDFIMDLYLQDKTFIRSFRVGLGKAGRDTPTGLWRVRPPGKAKFIKPPWPDPDTGKMYYGEDSDYPLGSRWIGLDGLEGNAKGRTGFGIHGTKDPEQIGKADSRGCIRMYNGDVILVYDLFVESISTVRVVD